MKYEFIKNGADDYSLKYKDKEIKFNSNIDIVNRMQEANKNARIRMIQELGRAGMTIKELTKEIKKDGKTYYDNSNKEELEKTYIEEENTKTFLNIVKELFGMELIELLQDIGLSNENEIQEFSTTLGKVLTGQFPSKK